MPALIRHPPCPTLPIVMLAAFPLSKLAASDYAAPTKSGGDFSA
jgi:hypothetical protein